MSVDKLKTSDITITSYIPTVERLGGKKGAIKKKIIELQY